MLPNRPLINLPDSTPGYEATGLRVSVVMPKGRHNFCDNSSFEISVDGWLGAGVNNPAVSFEWQAIGAKSCKYTCDDALTELGHIIDSRYFDFMEDATIGVSFYFKGVSGYRYFAAMGITGVGYTTYRNTIEWIGTGQTQFIRFVMQPIAASVPKNGYRFYIQQLLPDNVMAPFYIDGVLIEDIGDNLQHTTYFDGDSLGMIPTRQDFYWKGGVHSSASVRIAQSAAGGYEVFLDDLGFRLTSTIGLGIYSPNNILNPIGRGQTLYQDSNVIGRTFTLIGKIYATGASEHLRSIRGAIEETLKPNRVSKPQPIILRFYASNNEIPLQIEAVYQSGLEGNTDNSYQENISLTFQASDVFLQRVTSVGYNIGTDTPISPSRVLRRLPTGLWEVLDTGLAGSGTRQFIVSPASGIVYVVGALTNKALYYDEASTTWIPLDSNNPPDNTVNAIAAELTGTYLWIGGLFLNVGGAARTRVARYTINGGTWTTLSTGLDNTVNTILVDNNNLSWWGGAFTGYVATWNENLVQFDVMGTPDVGSQCYKLALSPDGVVYAACASAVKYWDGANWQSIGATAGGNARNLVFMPNGDLFCSGDYTSIGGVTAYGKAFWNGNYWVAAGEDIGDSFDAALAPNGLLVAKGSVSSIVSTFWWNGYRWCLRDIGGVSALSDNWTGMTFDREGNLYVGIDGFGSSNRANILSVTNQGKEEAELHFTIKGISGARLSCIGNYTTDKFIYFDDMPLSSNEVAHIVITKSGLRTWSNLRTDLGRYILQGSNDDLFLVPGENSIGIFCQDGNEAYLHYYPTYYSLSR